MLTLTVWPRRLSSPLGAAMTDKPRCRILVVEDEAMIAMLVEDMVLDFGSEVVGPAAKMEEALRLASDASLDAAILDVNVGGAVVYPGRRPASRSGRADHFRDRLWGGRASTAVPKGPRALQAV